MARTAKPKTTAGAGPLGGAGRTGLPEIAVGGSTPAQPDTGLPPLELADGKVRSWTAGHLGLTLVLRSEIGTTFTLQNTQPHYASVLSTIIAAHARDEKIVVAWRAIGHPGPTVPLSAVGVGIDPVFV
jgi:hypothetical protein